MEGWIDGWDRGVELTDWRMAKVRTIGGSNGGTEEREERRNDDVKDERKQGTSNSNQEDDVILARGGADGGLGEGSNLVKKETGTRK